MTVTTASWSNWVRSGDWKGAADPSIPMVPALAHEAIAIAADPNVTITNLSRVVSKDPSLATRVVYLANAAHCAPMQTVTTLTESIVRLGTSAVRNLVIAACLAAKGSDAKIYGPSGREQIDHAIGTAYMTHIVGERIGWDRNEAFLAGLLHDIGKLLLLKLAHDYGRSHSTTVDPAEIADVLASEHAALGADLLQSMKFPSNIIEGIRWHHAPVEAPEFQREAEGLYFADWLSHRYGFGCAKDETPLADDVMCGCVAPTEAWVESIDGRATGLYEVARRILG